MPRPAASLFAVLSCLLLVFAWISDRALDSQARRAQEDAEKGATDSLRLTAAAVAGALTDIEERVLSERALPPGVAVERLGIAPTISGPGPGFVPYERRPRWELARLLQSTASSPSGLPEAVVARLALGSGAILSSADAPPTADVPERLLSGALPVRAEDIPYLARALGVASDPRVAALSSRLRSAPASDRLPSAPTFDRTTHDHRVAGATIAGHQCISYDVPLVRVLEVAHATSDVTEGTAGAVSALSIAVAGVPGLSLRQPVRAKKAERLRALRATLWLAMTASCAGLLIVRRAIDAESRATAREKKFLASVTHELRTPLAAIRLFGERLADGRGNAREYGILIAEESQRLEVLVERVLAATRASERPHLATVDPEALVRSAVTLIQPRADRRDVTLSFRSVSALPAARWDEDAVRRAVLNLLDNAIRHGRQGGKVDVGAFTDGADVCVAVSDDGPGIARRDRKILFGRFMRGESDAAGAGLGLHFTEQVAHTHGGRVDLVSEEGRGCVFTLRLPIDPPSAATGAPTAS